MMRWLGLLWELHPTRHALTMLLQPLPSAGHHSGKLTYSHVSFFTYMCPLFFCYYCLVLVDSEMLFFCEVVLKFSPSFLKYIYSLVIKYQTLILTIHCLSSIHIHALDGCVLDMKIMTMWSTLIAVFTLLSTTGEFHNPCLSNFHIQILLTHK